MHGACGCTLHSRVYRWLSCESWSWGCGNGRVVWKPRSPKWYLKKLRTTNWKAASFRRHNSQTNQYFLYSEFIKALQLQEYWSNCSVSNFLIIYVCDLNRKNNKHMIICSVTDYSRNQILTVALAKKKEEHNSSKDMSIWSIQTLLLYSLHYIE